MKNEIVVIDLDDNANHNIQSELSSKERVGFTLTETKTTKGFRIHDGKSVKPKIILIFSKL